MDRERFESIQRAFDTALELRAAERSAYLDATLGHDPAARAEVERLLALEETGETDGQLERAMAEAARSFTDDAALPPARTLGSYRLLRDLGRGGMGVVWLAERADDAYRAQVAIKLVRGGFASPELERRFRAERQILADLRHPGIARLLDGGTAPDGTPYLVMEYVDGEPITAYAARHALDLAARLQLFRRVCDAVQHAHASLVVHRDIKPSNILVDADGAPKLLDFGIAKPLAPDAGSETTVAVRLLTPSYASPEQIRGERITVATDVYALGVLLHELLTGAPPFAAAAGAEIETQRRILEEEPVPASRALAARLAATTADAHAAPAPPLRPRTLAPELDNIIGKALRKEPAERYGSVGQLADDVDRFLHGEPVLARGAGAAYRMRRFVARHRTAVAGVAAAVLLIVLLTGFYLVDLQRERDRAERQRDLAEQERARAEQVSAFMINLFQYVDPEASRGATVTAREVMEEAVRQLDTALVGQPEVRAAMLSNIAEVYINIGLREHAGPVVDEVIRVLRSRPHAPDHPLARAYYLKARHTQDGEDWQRALTVADSAGDQGVAERLVAQAAVAHGMARRGEWEESLRLMRRTLDEAAARAEAFPDAFAETQTSFGRLLIQNVRYAEALPYLEDAVTRRMRALGRDEPRTVASLSLYSTALLALARYEQAEPIERELVALVRQLRGDSSAAAGFRLSLLSSTMRSVGDVRAADSLAVLGLRILRRHYPGDHWNTGIALRNLGNARAARGDLRSAERELRAAAEMLERLASPTDPMVLRVRADLARVLADAGRLREAESLMRAALAAGEAAAVPIPMQVGHHRTRLAQILLLRGDVATADSLLQLAAAQLDSVLHRQHDVWAEVHLARARVALARGDAPRADSLASESLRIYRAIAPRNRAWLAEAERVAALAAAALR